MTENMSLVLAIILSISALLIPCLIFMQLRLMYLTKKMNANGCKSDYIAKIADYDEGRVPVVVILVLAWVIFFLSYFTELFYKLLT